VINLAFEWKILSRKQLDFIANSDARINIAHGSVRSGKTIASLIRFIDFLGRSPHKNFLVTGKTRDSLFRNIISPILEMTEGIPYKYNKMEGLLEIFGKNLHLMGLKDEGVTSKLKGLTVGGWYGDEADEYPYSAVMVGIERCSEEGAKIFWTMNPGSPYSWMYTDYITNEEGIASGRIKIFHFLLEDNLSLDPQYVEDLKANHIGVFYQRNILGRWVLAEGCIYDVYVPNQHDFNDKIDFKKDYDEIRVGVDYGPAGTTCFTMVGANYETNGSKKEPTFAVIKEWVYNARDIGINKTDGDFAKDMKDFLRGIKYSVVNTPHDAVSLNTEFVRQGIKCQMVKQDVVEAIEFIRNLFAENRMKIHEDCNYTKTGLVTYIWDPKTVGTKAKPLKVDDHIMDSFRYAVNMVEEKKPIIGMVGYF
jgi:PBSX family phage terminase large subunit